MGTNLRTLRPQSLLVILLTVITGERSYVHTYTQTNDVKHEVNGLLTYDRAYEKMEAETINEVNQTVISESKNMK